MLRADGVVYFHLFLLIVRCVTLETHDKRCVKEGKTGEKDNCSDSASLRRAGKILARTGGIPSGSWICLKHRNEMNRNDKRCSCPSSWGHSRKLAKIPIPNRLYQVFDQVGKSFADYKPGTNWCTKCKVEADKKFTEHGKYVPRKRKTCNKQKVQQFLTFISTSSRCTS